jgi:hypothetical protein
MKKLFENKPLSVLLGCCALGLLFLLALLFTQSDWVAMCMMYTPFFFSSFCVFFVGTFAFPSWSDFWLPFLFLLLYVLPWLALATSAILAALRHQRWRTVGFVFLGIDLFFWFTQFYASPSIAWLIPLALNLALGTLLHFATRRKDNTVYSPKQIETLTK